MFNRPSNRDDQYTIADFLEYMCIESSSAISSLSYRSLLSMGDDEIENEGIESSDDFSEDCLACAISECNSREQVCPNRYPFTTSYSSIEVKPKVSWHKDIYIFLLLATRLNMNSQRLQGGIDGTQLFEELCASVAKEYYGTHSSALVFGTSVSGSFRDKVTNLLKQLNIKGCYKPPVGSTNRQKDGNLDIVVWIPFADRKDGQMIAMGQCKTGTTWEGMLTELNPCNFFSCYSSQMPYAKPHKVFFVAESIGDYKWEERSRDGGIIFDRMRIMEFLPEELDAGLLDSIRKWNASAICAIESNG